MNAPPSHARFMLVGALLLIGASLGQASADSAPGGAAVSTSSMTKGKGNSEEGRKIYHGKGLCYQCHGYDGYIDRLPEMRPDMRDMIDKMNPKPSDFRNPSTLKSKNDPDRFDAIQNGHPNTAMFPHKYLKDSEINDILAYLSILRSEGQSQSSPKR